MNLLYGHFLPGPLGGQGFLGLEKISAVNSCESTTTSFPDSITGMHTSGMSTLFFSSDIRVSPSIKNAAILIVFILNHQISCVSLFYTPINYFLLDLMGRSA